MCLHFGYKAVLFGGVGTSRFVSIFMCLRLSLVSGSDRSVCLL